jgi:hypothetical protein
MTLVPWIKGQPLVWDVTIVDTLADSYVLKTSEVSGFAAEMSCKRKHSKYSSIISSNYIFKGLAFDTLRLLVQRSHRFKCHRKPTYCGVRRFKIKEIHFREDFPCYSTWKRYKHSGHFSRFRIITGIFFIVNQKCYVLKLLINIFNNSKKIQK